MQKKTNTLEEIHLFGVDIGLREIYLHPRYEMEEEINNTTAVMFEKNLRHLDSLNNKTILIHMHCPGGSWDDGIAMYDAIKNTASKVVILVYSGASSMSGILLQAADLRIFQPNAHFLAHHGYFDMSDSQMVVEANIDWTKKLREKMIEIFAERCQNGPFFTGKSLSKVKQYLRAKLKDKLDWFLPPTEAVNLGFGDGILGDKEYLNIEKLKQF